MTYFAFGSRPLRDLVGIVRRRQPGPDVEELANSRLASQVTNGAGQKAPRRARHHGDTREDFLVLIASFAVDRVIVLAAQPVVPDPGRMRDGGVDPCPGSAIG